MKSVLIVALLFLCIDQGYSLIPQYEIDALRDLYVAWDGSNWVDNTNWPNQTDTEVRATHTAIQ